MPLYEYKCKSCNKTFEVLQRISAEPLSNCKFCRGDVEKLISVSSFQFKGSGWYITDYKNKSEKSSSSKKSNTTGSDKDASTNK